MATTEGEIPLVSIGKGIYLCRPIESVGKDHSATMVPDPTVILIFGWMGAKLPHLLKYTKVYDEIYPTATKILVRSEASFFWTSRNGRKANLAPVVEALEALGFVPSGGKYKQIDGEPPIPGPPPRVLVHAFSNGGSWQLATLSSVLAERLKESEYPTQDLPPTAIILDSCPGSGGIEGTQKAFLTAIRNPILRRLAGFFITLFYIYSVIVERVFRIPSTLVKMKVTLNQHRLLPWFSKETPRLYIYSKTDELIPWTQVELHAADARKAGLETRLELYESSPHVAHSRSDPDRYWKAVKSLWEYVSVGRGVSG